MAVAGLDSVGGPFWEFGEHTKLFHLIDYLGMGPEVLAAMHAEIDRCGTGIIAIMYIDKDARF